MNDNAGVKFGKAEKKIIAGIIESSQGRFRPEDAGDFPNWAEVYRAFNQAKVILEVIDHVGQVANTPALLNVENGNAILQKMPDQLFLDLETGEPVAGKIPAQILREQVTGEIGLYVANARLVIDDDLDKGLASDQQWAPDLYRKGLQMTLAVEPFPGLDDPEAEYENAIYATVGEKVSLHLSQRVQGLLKRRSGRGISFG